MTDWIKRPEPLLEVVQRPCFAYSQKSCAAYELFRQALVEGSPAAWEKLYTQYWPLVLSWVQKESAFAVSGEEAQDFANRAFEKFWQSITPGKFAHFANLSALLKYLRLCVRSVVIDEARRTQQSWLELHADADVHRLADADVAEEYYQTLQRALFWTHIQARLKSEKERQLLYYRFVLGLKPNRICEQYGDTFSNTAEVYTMLQNILARLRRDPALQGFVLA